MRSLALMLLSGFTLTLFASAFAQTESPNLGRNLAATCANCHGTGGVSQTELESLAGKPREELVRKLQEFKTDKRTGTVMNQLAKGYTDSQIESIAAWFASQPAPAR